MWARFIDKPFPSFYPTDQSVRDIPSDKCIRVAVTPLDDIEALVERVALALLNLERRNDSMRPRKRLEVFPKTTVEFYRERAAVALTAAGIPCKQRRAGK